MRIRRSLLLFLFSLLLSLLGCGSSAAPAEEPEPVQEVTYRMVSEEFNNYQNQQADDPWLIREGSLWYYCWAEEDHILVSALSSPAAVSKEQGVTVFDGAAAGYLSIWAPELHLIDGVWYIYSAMSEGDGANENHRMYVLKCTGDSPLSPFELVGKLTDQSDRWAIDGTVFRWKGELYTIWSGWPGSVDGAQNLYIAHMPDPCTIDSERVLISAPDSWDSITLNPKVNEGPAVLISGDTVYCLFSGNGSWTDDYAIGVLTLQGEDPMDASAWVKSESPLVSKHAGFYGPGHCSLFTDANDTLYLALHANLNSGSGWYGRSLRFLPLTVEENGLSVPQRCPNTVTLWGFAPAEGE